MTTALEGWASDAPTGPHGLGDCTLPGPSANTVGTPVWISPSASAPTSWRMGCSFSRPATLALRWRESAIDLGPSALLFGVALRAVRRWRS